MTQNEVIIGLMRTAVAEKVSEQFLARIVDIYEHHYNKYHSLKEIMIEAGRELSL